jgi:hypothetical protein
MFVDGALTFRGFALKEPLPRASVHDTCGHSCIPPESGLQQTSYEARCETSCHVRIASVEHMRTPIRQGKG